MVENMLVGLEIAADRKLNSHVFAFILPKGKKQ
jgi:hypothetical protein